MNTVLALASVVIRELYRRKDFYVLFVLTAVITLAMGSVSFFNMPNIARDLKEICLLLVWVSGLVIALTTTARQIPAELENRTLFPLLAKPVTRAQVLAGKFLGCWFAVGVSLAVFYLFLGVISGSRDGAWPVWNYLQGFWLQWIMLAVVIAMVLFGSVLFTSPAENITICFLIVVGILFLGGHLNQVVLRQPEPTRTIGYTIYFLIPHLEWFDTREFIVYSRPLIAWSDVLLASLYATAYAGFFGFAAWLLFRRKALTS